MTSTQIAAAGYARLPSRTNPGPASHSHPPTAAGAMTVMSPPESPTGQSPDTASSGSQTLRNQLSTDPHASNLPLSCTRCQARKIKCDRTFPCSACRKARLDTQCTPATRATRKPRKHSAKEIKRRVERCEQYLREFSSSTTQQLLPRGAESNTIPGAHAPTPSLSAGGKSTGTPESSSSSPAWVPLPPHGMPMAEGKLVEGDNGKVVFMDNSMLASVHEELRSMRDIIAHTASEDYESPPSATPSTTASTNKSSLLLPFSDVNDVIPLWPPSAHVFRLWQTYLDRVNPLTKIIHAPSLQPYLVDASVSQHKVPPNLKCLCFGIFLMASLSLSDEEARVQLGSSRKDLLSRFSTGIEVLLRKLDFLRANDLVLLQALVLYMTSLQAGDHHSWNLNGVVVRIAQKMGLHRDGSALGLSPFKSEMRRRLWWQIIYLDGKFACSSGLTQALVPRGWTVPEPTNVNDADIFPAATEPFRDCEGPTEMVLVSFLNKITKFLLNAPGLEPGVFNKTGVGRDPSFAGPFRAACEELFRDLATLRETRCHPSGGRAHRMAAKLLDIFLEHFTNMFFGPGAGGGGAAVDGSLSCIGGLGGQATIDEHIFLLAVAQVSTCNQVTRACADTGFEWFAVVHFPVDVLVYLVRRLGLVGRELQEKGWEQVGMAYACHEHLFEMAEEEMIRVCGRSVVEAWRRRRDTLGREDGGGMMGEVPEYVKRLAGLLGMSVEIEPSVSGPHAGDNVAMMGAGSTDHLQGFDYPDPTSQLMNDMEGFPTMGPVVSSGPTFDELFSDGGGVGPGLNETELQNMTAQQMSYFMGFGMIPLARR